MGFSHYLSLNLLIERKQRRKIDFSRRDSIITMLSNVISNKKKTEGEKSAIFINPFRHLTGREDEAGLREKLGDENFVQIMQVFRYFQDMITADNSNKTKKKKKQKKKPGAPKRCLSAFLHYSNAIRHQIRHENPHLPMTDIAKTIAEQWRTLDAATKQVSCSNSCSILSQ